MDQLGDDFFADAGFPQNQHFGVGPGGRRNFRPQGDYRSTLSEQRGRLVRGTSTYL
jgi:hypothetical protein